MFKMNIFLVTFILSLTLFLTSCCLIDQIAENCEGRDLPIAAITNVPVPESNASPPIVRIGIYQRNEAEDCFEEIYFGSCDEESASTDGSSALRCPEITRNIEREDLWIRIIANDEGGMNQVEVYVFGENLSFQERDEQAFYHNYDGVLEATEAPRDYDPRSTRINCIHFDDWISITEASSSTIRINVVAYNIGGRREQHRGVGISQTFILNIE